MKKIYLIVLLACFSNLAQAQFDLGSIEKQAESALGTNGLSAMLTTLQSGLKPELFTSKFNTEKDKWLTKAQVVKDPAAASALLTELSNGLKTSAFKKGWDAIKPKFLTQSKAVKDMTGLAVLGKTFNSNLLPSSFSTAGAQSAFTNALGQLK